MNIPKERIAEELERRRAFLSKTVGMQAAVQSKNNVFQSILKNAEGNDGIDCAAARERMDYINRRFGEALSKVKSFEEALLGRIRDWDRFEESRRAVASWVQEAQALLAASHVETEGDVERHKAFFLRDSEPALQEMLSCAAALEGTLTDKRELSDEVRRLSDACRDLQKLAPGHLVKVEFGLAEQEVLRLMREVERQVQEEDLAFQQSRSVAAIMQDHNDFFKGSDVVDRVDGCLDKMAETAGADPALGQVLNERRGQWDAILGRIRSIFSQARSLKLIAN